MIMKLLSGDHPRSKTLSIVLLLIVFGLLFAPFLFPGTRSLDTAARICIFIVLVASYDLLLGYTGVVSFAHTMFFGIGAYGTALALTNMGASYAAIALGTVCGALAAGLFAFMIALFSLRVKAIFFAMMTLAVASAFLVLVSQLSWITGGEDGLSYRIPREMTTAYKLVQDKFLNVRINGKLITYYVIFFSSLSLFLILLRIVNSPFGRVLQAIRENAFRAEAIGYKVVHYSSVATVLSAVIAALSGSLIAIWLRYTGPATTLSMDIMVDILLMIVIGGMGSMYGAVIGVVLFLITQSYLQNLLGILQESLGSLPIVSEVVSPERWLLWLGILFICSIYWFPKGVVGRIRGG
ncbi:leucine/isoleucine/valine transporter permease subunit [Pseudovibrio axinellae]|uniref:Leucine/isoleucine/valine transporter permease subunit n=1 Tax=Pseudovibrio axinellae TaxID=989403 RepID=A0A165W0I9_9HYPH|nr:branched-chain amino acid ABC transporter permease [Pseudovibrio axinellae]KZL15764.1 leucine/isoleucine/valine transporter permease subunit [Pseudovibrio axinellae]SEQ62702.1 amino acid/amide ABC transporter membrane protein 2, HAAT family [Pseudovibrio axinellae]